MFIITDKQLTEFGEFIFVEKVLNLFAEINMQCNLEEEGEIQQYMGSLTAQARQYGLTTEKQIAVFIYASWLMGLGFEQKFTIVGTTLSNQGLSADQKMYWLSNWTSSIFNTLKETK